MSEVCYVWVNLLTLSRRRPLSCRNQSIDLLGKSMDWFLYDNSLRLEWVKEITGKFIETVREKTVKLNSRGLQLY